MDDYRHCPGKVTYHPKAELLPRSAFRPGCKQCKNCNALELQRKQHRKCKHGRAQCAEPAADVSIGDRCLEPRAIKGVFSVDLVHAHATVLPDLFVFFFRSSAPP
jgi:hypothetical protein